MTIPEKKLNNGFSMPVFGLGTYQFGEENNQEREIKAIKLAIELGLSHIDTAEKYTDGKCEEVVGKGIAGQDRSKLFLVSKVAEAHLNFNDIKTALAGSLRRLGTDYLDLYLMHRCPKENKFKETVLAMNELVDEGLVRNIGLSNSNTEHTKILQGLSKYPFVANQVHYNLQFREPEKDGLLEYCQNNNMLLIAWRPLNKAALSKSGLNIAAPGIELLDSMAKKYNKTPAQISINWLISQKNVVTLVKASSSDHLSENLGAIGWEMEKDDIEKLRNEFPDQQFVSDTVPLA